MRWTHTLPTGVYGEPVATADGGLALVSNDNDIQDDELQVINLATGTLRWAHRTGLAGPLVAARRLVLAVEGAAGQRLGSYDDQTGGSRWRFGGLPVNPVLTFLTGRVLLTWLALPPEYASTLTAIDLVTGRISWQFTPGSAAGGAPVGETLLLPARDARGRPAVLVLHGRLWLISLSDGHRLWTAPASVVPQMTSQMAGADLVTFQAPQASDNDLMLGENIPGLRLVSRDAATGALRWGRRIPRNAVDPVVPAGRDIVVRSDGPAADGQAPGVLLAYHAATGRLAWRITLPAPALAVPSPVHAGLLVEAGYDSAGCAMP